MNEPQNERWPSTPQVWLGNVSTYNDSRAAHLISTDVLKTDGSFPFDRATWVTWDVPALQ